jgi:hypothetical protein
VVTGVIGLRWHYFTDCVAGAAVGAGTVLALALLLDLASGAANSSGKLSDEVATPPEQVVPGGNR